MLYKRSTIMCDDDYAYDWGHFIDIDDAPINKINQVSRKMVYNVDAYYTATTSFPWLSESYLMTLEIPQRNPINDSCLCSTIVTTFTLGSIMLCFLI